MIKSAGIGIGTPIVLTSRSMKMAARPYCTRKKSRLFMLMFLSVLSMSFVKEYGKRAFLDYLKRIAFKVIHISHWEMVVQDRA